MKTRNGFVSNSSSSSFIVIDKSKGYEHFPEPINDGNLILGDKGVTEFGWDHTEYMSIYDRINFTYIQTDFGKDYNRLWMLEEVLKENIPGVKNIYWNITDWNITEEGKRRGYIDHQSSREEDTNMEMFENKDTLKDFIFGVGSYIQGGNDNDYDYDYSEE